MEISYEENSSEFCEETGSEYSAPGPLLEDTDSDEEKDCEKIAKEEINSLKGTYGENYVNRHHLYGIYFRNLMLCYEICTCNVDPIFNSAPSVNPFGVTPSQFIHRGPCCSMFKPQWCDQP